MQTATTERYLSVRETAEMLSLSEKTIRRRIDAGELDAVRVGSGKSSVRIRAGAVEQLLRPIAGTAA